MKRISVCMPLYNGEAFLEAQLRSILSQLDESDEVIVSDDGSTDRSRQIIADLADARIRIITGPGRGNPTYNVENALKAALGNYIFLADQDDVWLPGKVARMLAALKQADLVLHDCSVVDAELNMLAPSFFALHGTKPGFWANWWRNHFLGCCMAFRKEVLHKALPFPQPLPMHDSWLGLVASAWFTVALVHEPLLRYRRHGANASTTSAASGSSLWQKLVHRWWLLQAFIPTLWRKK